MDFIYSHARWDLLKVTQVFVVFQWRLSGSNKLSCLLVLSNLKKKKKKKRRRRRKRERDRDRDRDRQRDRETIRNMEILFNKAIAPFEERHTERRGGGGRGEREICKHERLKRKF